MKYTQYNFMKFGISLGGKTTDEISTICPKCSESRKKKSVPCLQVNTEKGVWNCKHCDWKGSVKSGEDVSCKRCYIRPHPLVPLPIDDTFTIEVSRRKMNMALLEHEGIAKVREYMPSAEDFIDCIAFPYVKRGELVNVKYRGLREKCFRQEANAEKVFYRQDSIKKSSVIITEGEWDALACVAAGFSSVVSVPDGAPAPNAKNYAAKFSFLDQDIDPFDGVREIVLAVDNDEPGRVLRDELMRRLDPDRCKVVEWPDGCKDASDVLMMHGREVLYDVLSHPEFPPVKDCVSPFDVEDKIRNLLERGSTRGLSTGWESLNELYTVDPSQLTILTGLPSSGKSEFLDALIVNLSTLHGWKFGICSPENSPVEKHMSKLIEKFLGKSFYHGSGNRLQPHELTEGLSVLHEHVKFLAPEDCVSIPYVLKRFSELVRRHGIRGVIIDPFNEFDHTRERGVSETEYIGKMIGDLKRWARKYAVHVWLVAHPAKLMRNAEGTYPVPTPYDISGSSHFYNKADCCITVHRDVENSKDISQIHVKKIRFKHIGKIGVTSLHWDRDTGRYYEQSESFTSLNQRTSHNYGYTDESH